MSTKKFWTMRDWPIAIEAKDEVEAVTRLTKSLSDVAERIKAGENLKTLFVESTDAAYYAYEQYGSYEQDDLIDEESYVDPQEDKKKKWNLN